MPNVAIILFTRYDPSLCYCSSSLYILYRFGEYLECWPNEQQWPKLDLCDPYSEDVSMIRSADNDCIIAFMIIEMNGIWRIDLFDLNIRRLKSCISKMRFDFWTKDTIMIPLRNGQMLLGDKNQLKIIDQQGNVKEEIKTQSVFNICFINTSQFVTRSQQILQYYQS